MKTPMQELIEWIELGEGGWNSNEIIDKAKSLIPAEKQMVIDAYDEGYDWNLLPPNGEEYFSKKYGE